MLLDLLFSLANGVENPALLVTEIALVLFIVLFSLSVHEAAHAWAAKRLGDYTAYNLGRVTLNPFRHLHPIGFLSMALVGIGWANPVPIDPRNFRDPRKGMMLSSLAGPLSNFCVATVAVLFESLTYFVFDRVNLSGSMTEGAFFVFQALAIFFYYTAFMNFSLAVFNLIPCPPFDGSRVFFYFLPKSWYFKVMRYERYLGLAILVLIMAMNRVLHFSPVSFIADGLHSLVGRPFELFFDILSRIL